jgi:ribonuclease BN (tRNA processing enzyme)
MKNRLFKLLALVAVGIAPAGTLAAVEPAPATPSLSASAAQKGTRLILLGTGAGPLISKVRSQPANLLVVDGRPYLIDCGEGTVRQLKLAGYEAKDVTRVFLSHLHFDHTAGIGSLAAFNWASGQRQPVEIFGPPGTAALTRKAVEAFAIPEAIFSAQFPPHPRMADIAKGNDVDARAGTVIYQDDKIRVTAIENSHYVTLHMAPQAYGPVKSYSYRIETPDRTIVFTGDTGPSAAVEQLAKGADILVSEVLDMNATVAKLREVFPGSDQEIAKLVAHMAEEHLSPQEVGKLAARAGVGMVVLSHISPATDVEANALEYTRGVSEFYDGPVVFGRDLVQF